MGPVKFEVTVFISEKPVKKVPGNSYPWWVLVVACRCVNCWTADKENISIQKKKKNGCGVVKQHSKRFHKHLAGQTETRKWRTGMCLPPLCDDQGERCIGRDAAQRHQGKARSTLVILQTATERHSQENGPPYSDQTIQPSFPFPDHTKNQANEKWWPLSRVVFQFHQGALNRMVSPQGGLWSLLRVVFGLSSGWSFIMVLSSGWSFSFIRVVSYHSGLSV